MRRATASPVWSGLSNDLFRGVDGRTVGAVRFKRLINSFSAELGGMAALTQNEGLCGMHFAGISGPMIVTCSCGKRRPGR
jgi:hypothetical protein